MMINKIYDPITQQPLPIAQLQINLNNSLFDIKPSLFIIVADKSGSMSGILYIL